MSAVLRVELKKFERAFAAVANELSVLRVQEFDVSPDGLRVVVARLDCELGEMLKSMRRVNASFDASLREATERAIGRLELGI